MMYLDRADPASFFSILAGITLIGLPFSAFAYRQMTA
ncbi:hypothetical protein QFZ25_002384 [Bacillus atrophaeus]|nr:hypothetical protein [Bacillus atrophaeus]